LFRGLTEIGKGGGGGGEKLGGGNESGKRERTTDGYLGYVEGMPKLIHGPARPERKNKKKGRRPRPMQEKARNASRRTDQGRRKGGTYSGTGKKERARYEISSISGKGKRGSRIAHRKRKEKGGKNLCPILHTRSQGKKRECSSGEGESIAKSSSLVGNSARGKKKEGNPGVCKKERGKRRKSRKGGGKMPLKLSKNFLGPSRAGRKKRKGGKKGKAKSSCLIGKPRKTKEDIHKFVSKV